MVLWWQEFLCLQNCGCTHTVNMLFHLGFTINVFFRIGLLPFLKVIISSGELTSLLGNNRELQWFFCLQGHLVWAVESGERCRPGLLGHSAVDHSQLADMNNSTSISKTTVGTGSGTSDRRLLTSSNSLLISNLCSFPSCLFTIVSSQF